jgi:uncharacterized protein (DUF2141 family)
MIVSAALWMIALSVTGKAAKATEAKTGTIDARIVNLRNDHGQVVCTLYKSAIGFPENSQGSVTIAVPIKGADAACVFNGLAYGSYAMVAFHDENHDGKFNRNWLGMPLEGFGFSNNPTVRVRAPTFDETKFPVDKREQSISIRLNYWF